MVDKGAPQKNQDRGDDDRTEYWNTTKDRLAWDVKVQESDHDKNGEQPKNDSS